MKSWFVFKKVVPAKSTWPCTLIRIPSTYVLRIIKTILSSHLLTKSCRKQNKKTTKNYFSSMKEGGVRTFSNIFMFVVAKCTERQTEIERRILIKSIRISSNHGSCSSVSDLCVNYYVTIL